MVQPSLVICDLQWSMINDLSEPYLALRTCLGDFCSSRGQWEVYVDGEGKSRYGSQNNWTQGMFYQKCFVYVQSIV